MPSIQLTHEEIAALTDLLTTMNPSGGPIAEVVKTLLKWKNWEYTRRDEEPAARRIWFKPLTGEQRLAFCNAYCAHTSDSLSSALTALKEFEKQGSMLLSIGLEKSLRLNIPDTFDEFSIPAGIPRPGYSGKPGEDWVGLRCDGCGQTTNVSTEFVVITCHCGEPLEVTEGLPLYTTPKFGPTLMEISNVHALRAARQSRVRVTEVVAGGDGS